MAVQQKQVHMLGELDSNALKGPEMAYPDSKKPPETETGATVCRLGMILFTEDKGA
jgi:hypothetical protein